MRIGFYVCLMLFSLACKPNQSVDQQTLNVPRPSFDWLVGNWTRSNNEPNNQTFENWEKVNDSLYHGLGFTMAKSDTVFMENIVLRGNHQDWQLEVSMKSDTAPTIFPVTKFDQNSFISENASNSFPKLISYEKLGDSLHATISGGAPAVSFKFGKSH